MHFCEMAVLIDGMGKRIEQVTEELLSVRKQLEKVEQHLFGIKTEVKTKASRIVAEAKYCSIHYI